MVNDIKNENIDEQIQKCANCSANSLLKCSNCYQISYCTKQCQKLDWITHKNNCKPFKIVINEKLGRYLIASKDIKQGEVILKESPIVVGPSISSVPLCLKCYQPISPFKKPIFCEKCNVAPTCSLTCNGSGHTDAECNRFKTNPYISAEKLIQNYQSLMPLRCLLLRKVDQEKWNAFISMESHLEKRRNTPIWRNYKLNVENALHKFNLITDEDIADELVQQICGILDINTFELRVPCFDRNWQHSNFTQCVRGVYLQAALMAHDCIGNTHLAVDDNFNMTVHASIPIAKNTPIYFNYTNALQGTSERQEHLLQGKYFTCECHRCSDPTECGTYMTSIICVRCRKGLVSPTNALEDTYEYNSIWKCSAKNCHYKCHGALIKTTVNCTKQIIENIDKTNLQAVESLIQKLLFTFSPMHSLIFDLKQCLVGLYSENLHFHTNQNSELLLTKKLQLCKEIIPILEIVEPGISRLTGISLYEMHKPMVTLANKKYDSDEITAEDLLNKLAQAEDALKKSISYLLYEPSASPEGRLACKAMNELKILRKNTANVEKLIAGKKVNVVKSRRNKK